MLLLSTPILALWLLIGPNLVTLAAQADAAQANGGSIAQREGKQREDWRHLEKTCARVDYNTADWGTQWAKELNAFRNWMGRGSGNAQELFKVFAYLSSLSEQPICVKSQTLSELDSQFAAKVAESARQRKEDSESGEEEESVKMGGHKDVYLFGQKGVHLVHMACAVKCKQSLLEPRETVAFILKIAEALKDAKEEDSTNFYAEVEATLGKLDENDFGGFLKSGLPSLRQKWTDVKGKCDEQKIREIAAKKSGHLKEKFELILQKSGREIKELAVWLLAPMQVEHLIEVIIYMTGLHKPFAITREALEMFGLAEKMEEAAEKFGAKLIHDGHNEKAVMWWFGPNGMVPLFIRQGDPSSTEEMPKYVDSEGKEFKEELERMELEEEIEFLKHIAREIVEHKGHPFHELAAAVASKLDEKWSGIKHKMEEDKQKFEQGWNYLKAHGFRATVGEKAKKFAVWLVTPERTYRLFRIALIATDAEVPVYLLLELLHAFGISDRMLKALNRLDEKLHENVKMFREGSPGGKFVDFMIGEEGVLPLILYDEDLEHDVRQDKFSTEAAFGNVFVNVVFKHEADGLDQLVEVLVERIESGEFQLGILRLWNLANKKLHEKLSAKETEETDKIGTVETEEAKAETGVGSPKGEAAQEKKANKFGVNFRRLTGLKIQMNCLGKPKTNE